jgi:hypothetical protein
MNKMPKFIYVFSEEEKDKMLELNYEIIKCDKDKHVYVFLNTEHLNFAIEEIKFALSDVLTF